MLPNLGQLSLHEGAETGGFYEPSPAEQASMNDDPVTLEKPLYTMSFRVRLPQNNADGSPRYKFFAPLELWTWIKSNNSLPAREGPVWYEDWWALCNTFNPTHQNIPAWAHRLERYDQYEARMAREAAERAQQEARERARAQREAEAEAARAAERAAERAAAPAAAAADDQGAGAPNNRRTLPRLRQGEVRRGAQRATDKLISWRFWLKGTRDEVRISHALGFMRTRFGEFIRTSPTLFNSADNWTDRLLLSVGTRDLGPPAGEGAGEPAPTFPVLYVDCHVFVPAPYAIIVQEYVANEMSELGYGVGSEMRRMFGVIGAWSRGPADPTDGVKNRGSWRDLPAALDEDLVEPSMTRQEYAAWRDWATDEEPVRIVPGRVGPQAETDWAVEWRFWLKGELPVEDQFMKYRMLEWFRLYFSRMPLPGTFNNSSFDYGERLHLYLAKRRLGLSGGTTEPAHVIQVDVQVYVPSRVFADDFVRRVNWLCNPDLSIEFDYKSAMRKLFGIESAMEWSHADKPTVRDKPDGRLARSKRMGPYSTERTVAPVLSRAEYDAWATFSHVPPNADQLAAMDREVRAGGEKRVRWRFWLKGEMTPEQKLASAIWMRRAFARYMVLHPIPRRFYYGADQFNDDDMHWFRRTRATIFQEPQTITNEQGSSFTVYPLRCEFEIYFDRPRASAFVQWAINQPQSWEHLAEDWVGFSPIRAWDGWDKPQQLDEDDPHDDTHDLMTGVPTESVHAWNQWAGWRRERRAAA